MVIHSRITAIGTYVPQRKLTNDDLEKMVDTSHEWIVQRTGIHERRIAERDEFTSDLCISAVRNLVFRYNKTIEDVDFIIVCTTTPDFPFPTVSCLIQAHFQIQNAGAIDISAACAGFTYGLIMAHGLIASGLHRKVLVIAGETLSKITDYSDRTTCVLFGDAASAVLVERDDQFEGFVSHHVGSDGTGGVHIYRTGLANRLGEQKLCDNNCIVQNGREVFRWVMRTIPNSIHQLINKSSQTINDVDWFIPHSANMRLIEPLCEKLEFPLERTLHSLTYFGNTSSSTIPLSLDLGIRNGKICIGDQALLYGFGAGLVHSGVLVRLQLDPVVNEPLRL
ncbi:ketoacyl-ACP synthase III [Cohnella algarum]|uniref:ketoacyl-ACP synthase III n=1 Tax=Cohnella algarum TaxID=2044859 RepID=UPI001F0882D6|nr:ketoacyl-ACP synthase III [Cohnella algarum]